MNDNDKIVRITKIKKNPLKTKIEDEIVNNICHDIERDFNLKENSLQKINNFPNTNKKYTVNNILQNQAHSSTKKVSDGDLLTSMTRRLAIVEKELKENNLKIKDLTSQNEKLKEKLQLTQTTNNPQSTPNCSNCAKLQTHIKELNLHIKELKEFIKDQGFVLVKTTPELDDQLDSLNTQIKNMAKELNLEEEFEEDDELQEVERKLPQEIDINVISRRIEEMNSLIYKDGNYSKFEMDADKIFKLKQRKELKIYFYKNGLTIEGYKFYEFGSIEAKRILHDILDGYSPYILKLAYPDGAVLQVVNNLHKEFTQSKFGDNKISGNSDTKVKKDKMSGEEFLKMFPEKVIRNGKVFNIREDMEQFVVVKTNNEYNLDKEEHFIDLSAQESIDKICKLKIKLVIVDKIITINVLKNEKFKAVFEYIKNLINSKSKGKMLIEKMEEFVLYSTYPFKLYSSEENKNLEELGMFPSYFLIFDEKAQINKI